MALSVIFQPKDLNVVPAIDIVAVHGLGGDATKTWTHPKSNALWLREFLPLHIPDARILSFGYNATAAFGHSTSDIVDHAKSLLASLLDKREEPQQKDRPIVFIAHSLGGIVVKQALLLARPDPRYQSICDATLGVVFFGTPHRGSSKAAYGKVLADIAQVALRRPKSSLLAALKSNSVVLQQITSDFRHQLSQYQIVSFYEQRPMKPLSTLIVEKQSALLDVPHEEQLPVDADHSAMCKFENADSDTLEKVWKRISRMRSASPKAVTAQSEPYNKYFEVPHLLSTVFTGQDAVIHRLHESMLGTNTASGPIQRRFVVFGLGGSGKTQICLKYIQTYREKYWAIFWIDASSSDSIQQAMTQIATLLQIETNISDVRRKLAHSSQSWLLIFDNADDPNLSLNKYFPTGDRGHVLITSRNPECRQYNTVGSELLGQMSLEDSKALLSKTMSGLSALSIADEEHGVQLITALGSLPLAITQAGAYIRESSHSLQQYLELYQRRRKELLKYHPRHNDTDYGHTAFTTWEVSLNHIEAIGDPVSEFALQILGLTCFYHHDNIPMTIFEQAWYNSDITHPDMQSKWLNDIAGASDVHDLVQASSMLLASYSLITRKSPGSISFHPLVRDWCQVKLHEERQHGQRQAVNLLASSINSEDDTEDHAYRRSLVPHVHACLELFERSGKDLSSEADAEPWTRLTIVFREGGFPWHALQLRKSVSSFYRTHFGDDHAVTIDSMADLARDYSCTGQYNIALALSQQCFQWRKGNFGEHHPDTLRSMDHLAYNYTQLGQYNDALTLRGQVFGLRKRHLGEYHPETLEALANLASAYGELGRYDDALETKEYVIRLQKSLLGETHPDTLLSLYHLSIIYSYIGRYKDALELAEQVVQLRERYQGEYHPDTLASLSHLADTYSDVDRNNDALEIKERVLRLRTNRLGESHPDTLLSIDNLEHTYGDLGRHNEALELKERVVRQLKSLLGEDHPRTLGSMNNLANSYANMGRYNDALELGSEVVRLHGTRLGDDHPMTLGLLHNLSLDYANVGRHQDALELQEQVVRLRKNRLGEDHPDTLRSMHALSASYLDFGRLEEAHQLEEQVVEKMNNKLGESHRSTLLAARLLRKIKMKQANATAGTDSVDTDTVDVQGPAPPTDSLQLEVTSNAGPIITEAANRPTPPSSRNRLSRFLKRHF